MKEQIKLSRFVFVHCQGTTMLRTIALATFIQVIFWGCHFGAEMEINNHSDTVAYIMKNNILYMLTLQKSTFGIGDTLWMTFEAQNLSTSDKVFHFNNVQQCGFELKDQDGTVVIYEPRIGLPATSRFQLDPFEKKQFSLWAFFRDADGNEIDAGGYVLEVFLLFPYSPRVRLKVRIQ